MEVTIMNHKGKYGVMGALIYAVIFVAYNLFIFLIFNGYTPVFWVSYFFMIVYFAIHIVCTFYISKDMNVRAFFFGIPLVSFTIFFVLAEFFCSFVFMLFRKSAPMKIAVLIQGILLCIFVVIIIVALMTRDMVQNVDEKIKTNVNFIKGLNVDVEMMIEKCTDAKTMEALKKLSETIKYSDPMGNSSVATQEQMIMQYMNEMRISFDSCDTMKVIELCREIELLFIERNKKLMISK
jgi:hypothetical protein